MFGLHKNNLKPCAPNPKAKLPKRVRNLRNCAAFVVALATIGLLFKSKFAALAGAALYVGLTCIT